MPKTLYLGGSRATAEIHMNLKGLSNGNSMKQLIPIHFEWICPWIPYRNRSFQVISDTLPLGNLGPEVILNSALASLRSLGLWAPALSVLMSGPALDVGFTSAASVCESGAKESLGCLDMSRLRPPYCLQLGLQWHV